MIDVKKWSLLTASVIIYWMAFLASSWLWWTVFIFLIPLYYLAINRTLSFKEGFFYGALLWGLLVSGVFYSIVQMAQGSMIIRILPVVAIIVYQAFFTGIWFWLTQKIISKLNIVSVPGKLAVWIATTALFFYWATRWSLSPFNSFEGYFFIHPLLPLAEHPVFLSLMPYLGKSILTGFLLVTNALCTLPFLGYSLWFALMSSSFWVVSIGLSISQARLSEPAWARRIAHIPHVFLSTSNLGSFAEDVQQKIKAVLGRHPETEVIAFPESSFDRINLDTAREIAQLWDSAHVSKPVSLIIGAFKWEKERYHNTAYWVYDGKIKGLFNKRHAMLLTEGMSSWYDFSLFKTLYHRDVPQVTPSDNPRVPFELLGGVNFVPYICSELFFNDKPDDTYPQSVIIALCNDHWSSADYVGRLMYLAARFKSIEWQRDIVYASYHYNGVLLKDGTIFPLHK